MKTTIIWGAIIAASIIAKLFGIIDWSWIWVMAPLWLPVALVLLGMFLYWFVMNVILKDYEL